MHRPSRWRGFRTITSRSRRSSSARCGRRCSSTSSGTFRFRRRTSSGSCRRGTHEAVLRGLLGNDLIEFQIDRYAANFLDCVDALRARGARRSREPDRARFATAPFTSARFRSASTSSASRRWRRRPRARARRQDAARRGTPKARANSACASTASTTRREFPSDIRALDTLWTESPRAARAVHVHLRLHAVAQRRARVQRRSSATSIAGRDRDQRPIRQPTTGRRSCSINENVDADLLAARVSRRRHVHRLVAAGRNESRRQGVRRLPARRARRAAS